MKALVKVRPEHGLDLLDVPEPVAGPGEVVIRVEAAKVCGSDIGRYQWTRNYADGAAKAMVHDLPRILGHEYSGTVVTVGPDVTTVREGDRIAVCAMLGCGRCPACDRGLPNVCRDRKTLGVHRDGGYAERAVVPERNCYVIPDTMSFELAAAVTSFATSTYAVEQANLEPGARVLIWGAGAIGLGVLLAARLRGAASAVVVDRAADRLRLAASLGAETFQPGDGDPGPLLLEALGPRSVDAVVEAAGAPESVAASLPVLKKNSPMVLIGNMRTASELDLMPLIMDSQRLIGSRSKSLAAWSVAIHTIEASGYEATLPPTVPFDAALTHFEETSSGRAGPFTILPGLPA